jgi:hypothetical protein
MYRYSRIDDEFFLEPPADVTFIGRRKAAAMDWLTAFGLFAVTAMLVFYALEKRSRWFILAFAAACLLGSAYGFLQGAWPFGIVEAIWAMVAFRRWWAEDSTETPTSK